MSEYSVTKQVLAYSVKRLMRRRPLSKITVGDICEECGMNRKSFYYHFHDKYDLINWIFSKEYTEEYADACTPGDQLLRLCLFMKKNAEFCRMALENRNEEGLYSYLLTVLRPLVASRMQGMAELDLDADFYIDSLCEQYRSFLVKWIAGGCETEPEKLVNMLYRCARLGAKIVPEAGLMNDHGRNNLITFPALSCGGRN